MSERVVLEVGATSSRCSACRRNADPTEIAHVMETMRGEGCGATFTHLVAPYPGTEEVVREMRPDLPLLHLNPTTPPASDTTP